MPNYHKILERQIAKFLGGQDGLSPELRQFIDAVNDTYVHADEDRALTERSLEISSQELMNINNKIREEITARTRELYQEHIRFVAALNSLRAGFIMFDTTDRVEMMNYAMRFILSPSYASGDIKQTDFTDVDMRRWSLEEIDMQLGGSINIKQSLAQALETKKPVEYKNINYSGHIINIFLATVFSKSSNGVDVLGAVMVTEDVV